MISFKDVEERDGEFIEKVYRSTREKELNLTGWPEDQKHRFIIMQSMAQLVDFKRNYKGTNYRIILYKKKPAGRLYLWETNSEVWVIDISLLPEFRGKGIGRSILSDIIERSRKKNKTVALHVALGNPARRLYERLGFKKVGATATHDCMELSGPGGKEE